MIPVTVLSLYKAIGIDILMHSLANLPEVVLRRSCNNYKTVTFLLTILIEPYLQAKY